MSRSNVNLSPSERGARILIGLIGAIGGALLLAGAAPPSPWPWNCY